MSTEIMERINKILENELSERHSYFQLKYFIIGKEPTLQGKMWQCIRELGSRKDSLNAIEIQNHELNDKKELIDIKIEKNNLTLKNIEESYELEFMIEEEKKEPEEEDKLEVLKRLAPNLYKMFDFSDVP